jgi:hypothetical protein
MDIHIDNAIDPGPPKLTDPPGPTPADTVPNLVSVSLLKHMMSFKFMLELLANRRLKILEELLVIVSRLR